MKTSHVAIIIVTHNSEAVLPKAMECVALQTLKPCQVLLVDTGSKDPSYLNKYDAKVLFAGAEVGFCVGNNVGYNALQDKINYVFFLNPDAFLTPDFLEKAVFYMEQAPDVGAVTGITLGYDLAKDQPSERYDTTGIFQTFFGKWYDRGQGQLVNPTLFSQEEEIQAICGAVFFARKAALDQCVVNGNEVFDSSFFMYKEDIDLSCRLRKRGWKLKLFPKLTAYHCRGWNPDRKKMPRVFRLCSARNECYIGWREKKPLAFAYSSLKYTLVKLFDL